MSFIEKINYLICEYLIIIYLNIKENNISNHILNCISNLLENINYIIVVDIIFNKNKTFIFYSSYLYFFSPILYIELYNNKYASKNNSTLFNSFNEEIILEENKINIDQISLILKKYFVDNVYDQNYYNNNYIIKLIILILIILIFIFLAINKIFKFFIVIKKICSIFLYLIFKPFLTPIILIFSRNIFIQFTDHFISIKLGYFLDLLLFLIFLIFSIIFYCYIIYSYGNNQIIYFLISKYYLIELILNFFNAFILTLRFNIRFSFNIQFIWIVIFLYNCYNKFKIFLFILNIRYIDKINIFFTFLAFSLLFSNFLSYFFTNYNLNQNFLKIINLTFILSVILILIYISVSNKQSLFINKLEKFLISKNNLFTFGIYQIFFPLNNVFILNFSQKKTQEIIFGKIIYNLKNYLCLNRNDFLFFDKDLKSIQKLLGLKKNKATLNLSFTTTTTTSSSTLEHIQKILLTKIKYLKFIAKNQSNLSFFQNNIDLLNYYKILLYFISEEKGFRIDYLLLKIIKNKNFKEKNLINQSIFRFLNYHFINLDKKKDNNFLNLSRLTIINLKINQNYLNIIKSFKIIINSFSHNSKELYKKTIIENLSVGNYIKDIMKYKKLIKNFYENSENDKFNFIEALLFNSNCNNIIDFFDLGNLDTLIENNNIFILKFEGNDNLSNQQIPVNYIEITKKKSNPLLQKSFLLLFPSTIRKIIFRDIKNNILKYKNYKTLLPLENNEKLLILCKFNFVGLPSFENKLYISCKLDSSKNNSINSAIINKFGFILKFGLFFKKYFGLSLTERESNLFKLLEIEDFNIEYSSEKIKMIEIKYRRLLKLIQRNLSDYKNKKDSKNYLENLNKIKNIYIENNPSLNMNEFNIKIKLEVKNSFLYKKEKYYLITINFDGLKLRKTSFVNCNNTTLDDNNLSEIKLSINASVASKISINTAKDNKWNITNQNQIKKMNNKGLFELLYLFFNFFVVLMAIIICFANHFLSNNYKETINRLKFFRFFNSYYYSNHFFFINKIVLVQNLSDNSNNIYNSLLTEFEELNISFDLNSFYKFHAIEESSYMLDIYQIEFKNYFEKLKKEIQNSMLHNISLMNFRGNMYNDTYKDLFTVLSNYFYYLSQYEGYYLKLPFIEYLNFEKYDDLVDINLRNAFTLIFNYPLLEIELDSINALIIDNYFNSFKLYKLRILILFYYFAFCILISIILFYSSLVVIDKKIIKINQKISQIENNHLLFLRKKLKITNKMIKNEISASKTFDALKNLSKEIQIKINKEKESYNEFSKLSIIEKKNNFKSPKISQKTTNNNKNKSTIVSISKSNISFINSQDISSKNLLKNNNELSKLNLNIKESELNSLPLYFNKKNNKFPNLLNRFPKITIIILIFFIAIISITIAASYVILNVFSKIKDKIHNRVSSDDFQSLLMNYYLINRYSILLNNSEIYELIDINLLLGNLISNYTEIMKNLENQGDSYKNYLEILNSVEACDKVLFEQGIYKQNIINICQKYPIFRTKYLTIVYGAIKTIKEVHNEFFLSNRTFQDIQKYFHHKFFQFCNFIYIVYGMEAIYYLNKNFIEIDYSDLLNKIFNVLIIVFVLMICFQTILYIYSTYFVLKKFLLIKKNFEILEQFFIDNNSNDKKKRK